jgi:hypothetical protein
MTRCPACGLDTAIQLNQSRYLCVACSSVSDTEVWRDVAHAVALWRAVRAMTEQEPRRLQALLSETNPNSGDAE